MMDMNKIMSLFIPKNGLLLPVITALAGAILTSLLKDGFPYMLAELLGGWCPGEKKFRGIWKTRYIYDTPDERKEDDPTFFVKQFGKWLKAKGTSSDRS